MNNKTFYYKCCSLQSSTWPHDESAPRPLQSATYHINWTCLLHQFYCRHEKCRHSCWSRQGPNVLLETWMYESMLEYPEILWLPPYSSRMGTSTLHPHCQPGYLDHLWTVKDLKHSSYSDHTGNHWCIIYQRVGRLSI